MKHFPIILAASATLAACGPSDQDRIDQLAPEGWPEQLNVVGEGYPAKGDPCRQLGNSAAVAAWAGEDVELIGCPTTRDANQLKEAQIVGEVGGYTILALRRPQKESEEEEEEESPLLPGINYRAVSQIYCEGRGYGSSVRCTAGVREDNDVETIVDIQFPNGNRRSLSFEGLTLVGADGSEADGSADFELSVRRQNGRQYISYGPERFIILDAMLRGSAPRPPSTDPLAPLASPDYPLEPTEGD
ncbi:hypothetical protein [Sphingomicrobium lutaoense]|uniref:Lipoprotein n=1 Tax=Sphingomicrobium lutaoense TaxID=515949 RepID=A0A839Z263_9SPHN|nr:hypothetical protein [Sphingomicrobium lutaoense]MBB3764730.1 hypothetical protein [Sphingomicrobium lutaoense]